MTVQQGITVLHGLLASRMRAAAISSIRSLPVSALAARLDKRSSIKCAGRPNRPSRRRANLLDNWASVPIDSSILSGSPTTKQPGFHSLTSCSTRAQSGWPCCAFKIVSGVAVLVSVCPVATPMRASQSQNHCRSLWLALHCGRGV